MNILSNFYNKLSSHKLALEGDLTAIRELTRDVYVINSRCDYHFNLLENVICELKDQSEECKILDVNVTGNNISDEADDALEILSLRLGNTFNDPWFQTSRTQFLEKYYRCRYSEVGTIWIHKDSKWDPKSFSTLIPHLDSYEKMDNMILNSMFGEIYYNRG